MPAQVFELTKGQHFSLETAEQLMMQLEREQQQLHGTAADSSSSSSSAKLHEANGAADSSSEAEEEAMEAPEQLLQLLAVSDGLPNLTSSAGAAAHTAAAAAAAAAARQRAYDQVLGAFAALLKSVANAAACGPGVWGLLGRLYRLQGQLLSSQEAWLKQVRLCCSSKTTADQTLLPQFEAWLQVKPVLWFGAVLQTGAVLQIEECYCEAAQGCNVTGSEYECAELAATPLSAPTHSPQVRALQSSPCKSDPDAFAAMAAATDHLCRAYLATAAAGQGGLRELSAARMQLRGLLKQCEDAFGEQQQYLQLQGLLGDVMAAEDAALAAKRAAEAAAQ